MLAQVSKVSSIASIAAIGTLVALVLLQLNSLRADKSSNQIEAQPTRIEIEIFQSPAPSPGCDPVNDPSSCIPG
ncbi:MAG: hypothetical protein HC769_10705 [Cyanobacteria bacterium CRU_2_1]|nr:hypothetical protein [Cyanobacteria bacterium RU_5_0]NJR59270.1 hypothetical protein [Cyanobacteria bacterium CRU_2_1]